MNIKETYFHWRKINPALTLFSLLSLAGSLVTLCLIFLDTTTILNEPAWLKPFKFFASSFILTATLPWPIKMIEKTFPRSASWVTWITISTMAIELAAISWQAARGVRSHFNFTTPFNSFTFVLMAVAILIFFLSQCYLVYRMFQSKPVMEKSMSVSFRLGMIIFLIGAASGWTMTSPNKEQKAQFQSGNTQVMSGAHTVGAPDGSEGIPLVGWAKKAGDLRVAHFIGMHALQVIPAIILILTIIGVAQSRRIQVAYSISASFVIFYFGSLYQAFNGISIVQYDLITWSIYGTSFLPLFLLVLPRKTSQSSGNNELELKTS